MKNLGRIVGTLGGPLISKSEENLWDIDIKEFGASHARQNACIRFKIPNPNLRGQSQIQSVVA